MKRTLSCLLLAALSLHGILGLKRAQAGNADPITPQETEFYQSLGRGDADAAYDLMHPALQELVDRPVLEAWAKAIQESLGGYLMTNRLVTSGTQKLTGVETNLESEVVFERGKATASMRFFDQKMVAFQLESDQLGDWFQGPSRIDLYTRRSETFIRAFLNQDTQAVRSLMHPALREAAEAKLDTMIQNIAANAGAPETIKLRSHRLSLEATRQVLVLVFELQCDRANGQCEIEIQFVGMQGHLIGFDFD